MIRTTLVRELSVATASSPERSRKLSAASGLVLAGDFIYIVADDENHLGVFPAQGGADGELVRLFPGELPEARKARKAGKADPEALTWLPAFAGFPQGALMAWGSGSKPSRRNGALFALDGKGALSGDPRAIDLSPMYLALEARFPELNIEGAVICADELVLMQRGSRKAPENACIRLPLAAVLDALSNARPVPAPESMDVQSVALGRIGTTMLSFTDAAALPDGRLVFTAVAENAKDSVEDGPCAGAAIGILARDGRIEWMRTLASVQKVEGVHAHVEGGRIHLLLVTDADDAAVPGLLLKAEIPLADAAG